MRQDKQTNKQTSKQGKFGLLRLCAVERLSFAKKKMILVSQPPGTAKSEKSGILGCRIPTFFWQNSEKYSIFGKILRKFGKYSGKFRKY